MRILLCPDSFKGTLSAAEVARVLAEAAYGALPDAECVRLPLADGGEGLLETIGPALGGETIRRTVRDPFDRPIDAAWVRTAEGRGLIEVAEAVGHGLRRPGDDPWRASSLGVGELIRAALDADVREIWVGLGGSATNDGGMGMAEALGARFLDAEGEPLRGCAASLARVAQVDLSRLDPRLSEARVTCLCDVDSPLTGPQGASRMFGAQKGLPETAFAGLDEAMGRYGSLVLRAAGRDPDRDPAGESAGDPVRDPAGVCVRDLRDPAGDPACVCARDLRDLPGAGAAGGLGFACAALLGAELAPGIDAVLDLVDFDGYLETVDLVVTGEGHADAQSARGKVVGGVARRAADAGVGAIAIVGAMDEGASALLDEGLAAIVPTLDGPCEPPRDGREARRNLRRCAERTFALIALGRRLG